MRETREPREEVFSSFHILYIRRFFTNDQESFIHWKTIHVYRTPFNIGFSSPEVALAQSQKAFSQITFLCSMPHLRVAFTFCNVVGIIDCCHYPVIVSDGKTGADVLV